MELQLHDWPNLARQRPCREYRPDHPGMVEDNLKSMAELARGNGVRPILASVLPAAVYPWRREIQPIDKILALNQWIKEYAEKEGFVYLDYYWAIVNGQHGLKADFTSDGVHPNAAGYAIMAPLVADAIARSKPQPSKKSPLTPMLSGLYLWLFWLWRPTRSTSRGFMIDVHNA